MKNFHARLWGTTAIKIILLFVLIFSLTACTVYPDGVGSNPNYISFGNGLGIILGSEQKHPEFVLNNNFSIPMIVDERIIGSWSFQSGVNNVVLSKDGTATTTTLSGYTRSGKWEWATGNVISITYQNNEYDIMRFDQVEDDLWFVTVFSDSESQPITFLAIKNDKSITL